MHVAELQRWYCLDAGPVLCRDDEGMCRPVTLVHAVDAVRGHEFVLCYREAQQNMWPVVSSLAGIGELVKR